MKSIQLIPLMLVSLNAFAVENTVSDGVMNAIHLIDEGRVCVEKAIAEGKTLDECVEAIKATLPPDWKDYATKDYNDCLDGADRAYKDSKDFCVKHERNRIDRKECLQIAEKHLKDREAGCERVEAIYQYTHPKVEVNFDVFKYGPGVQDVGPQPNQTYVPPAQGKYTPQGLRDFMKRK